MRPFIQRSWAMDWADDVDNGDVRPDDEFERWHDCGESSCGPDLAEVDRGEFIVDDHVLTRDPVDPHDEPDI